MNNIPVARIVAAVVILMALLVAVLAGWRYYQMSRAAQALPINTRMGGDFMLPSTRDVPLDTRQLRGKVVLLNFGFASCPDVCPMVLARLRQVVNELGADASGVQVVFVSFDPARDSIAQLKGYVAHFHPDIIGATGTETEIAAIARRYGVVYMKEDTGSAAGYGFAHSDFIYLLDAEGKVRKLYDNRTLTTDISRDIRTLLAADRLF
ncbi:MAG TPA: SCO family protein [Candidatus Kapabacteria bacterium]|nr:SCO family protein [Candidatus Kapabacteria bacterium]